MRLLGSLDRTFSVLVLTLALLGLYNLASAGKPLGEALHVTHAAHLAIGVGAAALVASFHYRNLEGLAMPILIAIVLLLLLTMGFGRVVNGSRRWLRLGIFTLQTSDLAKVAVIVVVAKTFHMVRWGGYLTLDDIFRPFNPSRPVLLLGAVVAVALAGDAVSPPKLERVERGRGLRLAQLTAESSVIRVGSAGRNEVQLRAGGVSDEHAQLVRVADGQYRVIDLGSENGTYLNGERVQSAELSDGDRIGFGSSPQAELRFSARLLRVRAWLPWLGLVGLLWLGVSVARIIRRGWSGRDLLSPIDVVMMPSVLILIQPDLGTTLVVLLIAFSMILFVGLRPSSLVALIAGACAFGVGAWFALLKPYQKERVLNFLNPTADLAGAGYHQNQSLIAVGSGELWGKGHGQGTQTQLSFLPEQQTDFIFSVWAEEQGFFGCVLVVGLFGALIVNFLRIALRARDRFGCLLVVGVTAMLFWHTVVNMLMVLRLAPVVGVPLPLWSQGGSFVLTAFLGFGMVASVDMRRKMF